MERLNQNPLSRNTLRDCRTLRQCKMPVKLKVLASTHGYGYIVRDLSGRLITSYVGLLPDYLFNESSRELFALAQAARRFNSPDLEAYRVALVCSSLPLAGSEQRRARAA